MATIQKKAQVRIVYSPKFPRTLNLRFGPEDQLGTLKHFNPGDVIVNGPEITAEMCRGSAEIAKRNTEYLRRLAADGEVKMVPIADDGARNLIDEFNQGAVDPIEVYPGDLSHEQNKPKGDMPPEE